MAMAAASLVDFVGPYHHNRVVVESGSAVDQTLGTAGRHPADDADGLQFIHFLGLSHQQGHGPEGLASEVHIQPSDDHSPAIVGQEVADIGDSPIEELPLVNGDHGGIRVH